MENIRTFNFFNKIIQNIAQSTVEKTIVYDIYMRLFFTEPQWIDYYGENYCIIGFSEDKWDYYWVCINNKTKELKFITYLYKLKPSKNNIIKTWNKEEKRNIKNFVLDYFKNNKNENLIYLNDNINSFEIL